MKNSDKKLSRSELEAELRSQRAVNQILTSALVNSSRKCAELSEVTKDPLAYVEKEICRLKKYQDARFKVLNSILEESRKAKVNKEIFTDELDKASKSQSSDFKMISAEYWKHVHQTEEDPMACWRPEIDYVTGFLIWFFGRPKEVSQLGNPQEDLDSVMMEVRQESNERLIKGLERTIELINEALMKKTLKEEIDTAKIWKLTQALKLTQDPDWYWKERPTSERPFGTLKSWGDIRAELGRYLKGGNK
ncbi:hypothetical protein [Bdellovibrio sp. BCCA]|uniref:hypothetical protein n=1 Tax=Bdellovibrio sp. BCCA TaxID=3136281 RepID=UPI0030F06EDA